MHVLIARDADELAEIAACSYQNEFALAHLRLTATAH